MCSIKAFYQATSWQEVQQKLFLMPELDCTYVMYRICAFQFQNVIMQT
jgi:hypothetical protein